MQEQKIELGKLREALELITSCDWEKPLPRLLEHPLLIVRASAAFNRTYTMSDLQELHVHLQEIESSFRFEEMTAQDFLDALHPVIVRRVA